MLDAVDNRRVVIVYLDSAPENLVPELGLRVVSILPERWNGWLRPLGTADAFGNFLDAWRRNDPNGIWGWATEVGDTLVCSRSDDDDPADEFPGRWTRFLTVAPFTTSPDGRGWRMLRCNGARRQSPTWLRRRRASNSAIGTATAFPIAPMLRERATGNS